MVINKLGIREQNEAIVLKTIIDNQYISRADVSNVTGLNKASVSQIAKKLIEKKFINEVGIGESTSIGGRKPIKLQFNSRSGLAIALDIGYNYVKGMLAYIDGTKISFSSTEDLQLSRDNILQNVEAVIKKFMETMPQTPHGLVGICLAIHGIVDQEQISFAPYYDLKNFDLITPLREKYNTDVYIENEANLTGLGEYCFSSESNNLISISIHSGIGVGVVGNGQLQIGTHGAFGEVGHSILFPQGKPCPCGNKGCLEQYASNKVLFDSYTEYTDSEIVNSDVFAEAYLSGEKNAVKLAHQNVEFLAIGLNNLITICDPEEIYLNSSVYRKIPSLIQKLREQLGSRFTANTNIRNSKLGEQAPLYGGIVVVGKHFLNIQNLRFPAND